MNIALKTLIFEWRRFLPAVVAVGFSGLLVLLQAAVILGVFSLSSIYVTRSSADLWIGYPGVQSIDLGRPIDGGVEYLVRANPGITKAEPFVWGSGEWRTPVQGIVNVYIVGLDLRQGAMALSDAITPELRARLAEPGGVLVDEADLDKLGATLGSAAAVNGSRVHIVGLTNGLRGLGGVNVIGSLDTANALDPAASSNGEVAYVIARVAAGQDAERVATQLNVIGGRRGYEAMTARGFADRTTQYWLSESGAGIAFLFGSAIAILVAVVVASQTLSAAVASSIKEYAALRALGFPINALRRIVLGQTLWIALAGLCLGAPVFALLAIIARSQDVPIVISPLLMLTGAVVIVIVGGLSGLLALRRVSSADPAILLQ